MPLDKDIREHVPGEVFREDDETTLYWIKDGKMMYRHYPIRGADVATFRFYRGGFGKDHKHCYANGIRLKDGDGASFRALNFCYATDGRSVWTMGGKVKDADVGSFVVCDDGYREDRPTRYPYGYAKDKDRVYYYDFQGKPNWVRKADPATFESLNDGFFGRDANAIFCDTRVLKKADLATWRRLDSFYSRDNRRIFYFTTEIKGADLETFEVVSTGVPPLARDKNNFYDCFKIVDERHFKEMLKNSR